MLYDSPASPKKSNEKSQGRETAPRWDASLQRSILPDFAYKLTNFSAIFTSFILKKFYIRSAKHTGGGGIGIKYRLLRSEALPIRGCAIYKPYLPI